MEVGLGRFLVGFVEEENRLCFVNFYLILPLFNWLLIACSNVIGGSTFNNLMVMS